jgi:hypothetical protein
MGTQISGGKLDREEGLKDMVITLMLLNSYENCYSYYENYIFNKQSTTQPHQIHGPHFFSHSAIGPKNLK